MIRESAEDARLAIRRAAAEMFAARGFRAATVRDICRAAGANIALVSRYFGSKAGLYASVCKSLFDGAAAPLALLDRGIDSAARWKAAVREWIARVLALTSSRESPGREISGIFRHEMTSPSSMHGYLKRKFMKPAFDCLKHLVEMGGSPSPAETLRHLSAVWSQVSIYALLDETWQRHFRPSRVSRRRWMSTVADGICAGLFQSLSYKEP